MLSLLGVRGAGKRYLVPFVAPPSAHPVGPHGGEEGQVVAIGLGQEHRLPRVQGQAGAGVPLLRNSGPEREKAAGLCLLPPQTRRPALCSQALCPPPGPWLRVGMSFLLLL